MGPTYRLPACLVVILVIFNPVSSWELLESSAVRSLQQSSPTPAKNTFPSPVQDIEWVSTSDTLVFAYTGDKLFFSNNGGVTFTDFQSQKLESSISKGEPVNIIGIYSQKSNPNNILLVGDRSYVWISNDGGGTVRPYRLPNGWQGRNILNIRVHPWQETWMLAEMYRPCTIHGAMYDCPTDLLLTRDMFGDLTNSWMNLTALSNGRIAGFVDSEWGAELCPDRQCGSTNIQESTIFATAYYNLNDYNQAWDKDVYFVVSSDFFATYQQHAACGNQFEIVGSRVYLAYANECPTDINGKARSADRYPRDITLFTSADAVTFGMACMPVALQQSGYELLETSDGDGALAVVQFTDHTPDGPIYAANIFTAGPQHFMFSLSLPDVYVDPYTGKADVTRIAYLPGVYIANRITVRGTPDYYIFYYESLDSASNDVVESFVTFNGGGTWNRIPAPTTYRNSICNQCEGNAKCFLHLNGPSSWTTYFTSEPSVYSHQSAPGVIIGVGNTAPAGKGLHDKSGICTWMSTDGGVHWFDIGVGAHIYEIADWGNVMVMARHSSVGPTAVVHYSLDYGVSWVDIDLPEALTVDNIRVEPDGALATVILHGSACFQHTNIACAVNISETMTDLYGLSYTITLLQGARPCEAGDFEVFTVPNMDSTPRCLLGQETRITRRRSSLSTICSIPTAYQRPAPTTTPCLCAITDTECDYGYMKNKDNACVAVAADKLPTSCAPLDGYVVSRTGRRQVHNDSCVNIAGVIPDTDGKGRWNPNSGHGPVPKGKVIHHGGTHSAGFGFGMFILSLSVVLIIFGVWYRFLANESQKIMVGDCMSGFVGFVVNIWDVIREKVSSCFGRRPNMHVDELTAVEGHYFQPLSGSDAERH